MVKLSLDPRVMFGTGKGVAGLLVALAALTLIILLVSKRLNVSVPVLTPLAEKVVGA